MKKQTILWVLFIAVCLAAGSIAVSEVRNNRKIVNELTVYIVRHQGRQHRLKSITKDEGNRLSGVDIYGVDVEITSPFEIYGPLK